MGTGGGRTENRTSALLVQINLVRSLAGDGPCRPHIAFYLDGRRPARSGASAHGNRRVLVCRLPEASKSAREVRGLMARVETAGIRQDPEAGPAERLWLWPERGVRLRKRNPERGDPQNRDPSGSKSADLSLQAAPTRDQLDSGQFVRLGTGTRHDVREAVTQGEQQAALGWIQDAFRKPGRAQGRPEPVARPREVVTDRRRVQTRVDAAE